MRLEKGKSPEDINPQTNPRAYWASISARAWRNTSGIKATAVLSTLIALSLASLRSLGTGDTRGSVLWGIIAGFTVLCCSVLLEYLRRRREAIEETASAQFIHIADLKRQLADMVARQDDREHVARQKIVNELVTSYVHQNTGEDEVTRDWARGWLSGAEPIEKYWAEQELQAKGIEWRMPEYRMDPSI